ncbi:MAG: hypothetical protein ACKOEO_17185, partial [Planctomycetaceae bacterium]
YHAASQRILQLTPGVLPDADAHGLTLTVTWPGGRTVTLNDVPINSRLHLIENRVEPYPAPH